MATRGVGQGYGFQPIDPNTSIKSFSLATGCGCSCGDALRTTATQAGYLRQASAGDTKIAAVAAETVASSASGHPTVKCYDLSHQPRFRVQTDAKPTASNFNQAVALEEAYQIDPDDTTGTSGQVFFMEKIDPYETHGCVGVFVSTPYSTDD